jgi:ABC-2 type transport system permease protein
MSGASAPTVRRATTGSGGALALGTARVRLELLQLFRDRQQAIFTFAFPMILLLIFGSVFSQQIAPGVSFSQYFVAAMIASGVVYTGFQNLAIVVPMEREDGVLKRLRATPMPPAAYFIGKIGQVIAGYIGQVVVLLAIGSALFKLKIPTSPEKWWTFTWLSILGVASCTLLGLAFAAIPKNAKAAPAVVTPIVLVLQFTSGVYFQYSSEPAWMRLVASFFPLKWLAQGMRSVFLPDSMAQLEPAHSWQHGMTALVLIIWTIIGAVLATKSFRWQPRGSD